MRKIFENKETGALKFYAIKLMTKYMKNWKTESKMARIRQKRSKLYAIISAWKFYTKERVLLKKYLKECNISDSNLMSTQDMRK